MSKTSHTPGPWHIPHFADDASSCNCKSICSEVYTGAICTIHIGNGLPVGEGGNDAPPLEEAKANARLIAAAPGLLTALKAMDEALCAGFETQSGRMAGRRALIAARIAIAKAEGGAA